MSAEQQAHTPNEDAEAVAPRIPPPAPPPPYKTLEEVAAELRVSPRWLRDFVRSHPIPMLKCGRSLRFDKRALAALEDELRVMPPGPFKWPPYRNGSPLPKRGRGQTVSDRLEAQIAENKRKRQEARKRQLEEAARNRAKPTR
jgi:Helix-turn-helix domain